MYMEIVSPNTIKLVEVMINYDLTPRDACGLLPTSDSELHLLANGMLWNGGRTGIVKATIPIHFGRNQFTTATGRQRMCDLGIGFAWPVEIASLALPENDPDRFLEDLRDQGIFRIVALRQSDKELYINYRSLRFFCISPHASYRAGRFFFSFDREWGCGDALSGAPSMLQ